MRSAFLAGLLGAIVLALPASAAAVPYAPIPTCSPGPASCPSWHNANVSISWQFEAGWTAITCDSRPVIADGAEDRTCTVSYGPDDVYSRTITVRRDGTAPAVTATPARGPDANGWYNRPVAIAFSGSDALSGIASCTNPTYGGGDGASVSVSGTCTDNAGNTSAPYSYALKYDATPPTVSVAADRGPDKKGWYRKPVTIAFSGADAMSGVAACTESTRYAGPDRQDAAVAGTCRDAAGNVAPEQKLSLRYDATAPKVSSARARVERGVAHVTWKRPADVAAVEIERKPGVNGRVASIVYQGQGQAFVDRTVKAGAVYRYEIRAADAAGNVGSLEVSTGQTQAQPLQRPAAGATVRAPVVLGWAAVKGARFYNVQLYRGGKKILSAWPKAASLRLAMTWQFGGKQQRLVAGVYRWYVWPARGTRERPTYGRVLGSSTFRVTR